MKNNLIIKLATILVLITCISPIDKVLAQNLATQSQVTVSLPMYMYNRGTQEESNETNLTENTKHVNREYSEEELNKEIKEIEMELEAVKRQIEQAKSIKTSLIVILMIIIIFALTVGCMDIARLLKICATVIVLAIGMKIMVTILVGTSFRF